MSVFFGVIEFQISSFSQQQRQTLFKDRMPDYPKNFFLKAISEISTEVFSCFQLDCELYLANYELLMVQFNESIGGKMKSFTIHGVEKPLADLIRAKAESEGLSINKTIKKLLEECLGVKPQPEGKNLRDFQDFCGQWAKDDLDEFEKKTSDLREIDDADWQ